MITSAQQFVALFLLTKIIDIFYLTINSLTSIQYGIEVRERISMDAI